MQSGFEILDGRPFFVRRWGSPDLPQLLLLHGFPEYGGAWSDLAEILCERFHVIAPDQRGFGQSWAPQDVSTVRMPHLISDIYHLLKEKPAIVMGHDWGAATAYGLAMTHPNLVSHLLVANGVHPVPFQRALASGGPQTDASQYIHHLRAKGSEQRLAENNFEGLLKLFSAKMDLSWLTSERLPEYRTEWSRPGRLRSMINWYRASPLIVPKSGKTCTMPDLPLDRLKVSCRHLLIWGEDDTALLPEATEGLEEFAPELTRISLPGADHWLIHQAPDTIAKMMLDWLT